MTPPASASTGLTAPRTQAQEKVITLALQDGNIQPEEIGYVEAHGTGTALGDPIEMNALKHVYTAHRNKDSPLVIGSVKTNFGHTEAAAGVAGIMKCVLALQKESIPAHLHYQSLNPNIDISDAPISIATEAMPWARGERPRFAAVSSFAFSGTNAHAILQEAPESLASDNTPGPYLLLLSAEDEDALTRQAKQLNEFFSMKSLCNLNNKVLLSKISH